MFFFRDEVTPEVAKPRCVGEIVTAKLHDTGLWNPWVINSLPKRGMRTLETPERGVHRAVAVLEVLRFGFAVLLSTIEV